MAGPTFMLAPDAFSGRKLGKYEILCRLSTGGMSEIFLAFQRGLAGFRKFVVLKQILPDIKGEEAFVRMFLDEAKITAAFTHPNIAQVFDLDIDDGELFLAMEFVPGATLLEVARACRQANEPIPIGFTLMAVRDTALALHYAHTFTDPLGRPQQVIHRDIAEKNIMVTYEGVTKLLDFGIAKALNRSSRTHVGMVKGTSGYMSPEQILGEPLDPRSDLFSLGVVLHECLTGMRLFHAKTPEDGMMMTLKAEVAPPSAINPDVPPEIDSVVRKALQRSREDRFAHALEFARAIESVSAGLIWHPEQSGALIQRLFAQRREQTRLLMSHAQVQSGEYTGEIKLAQFLGNEPDEHERTQIEIVRTPERPARRRPQSLHEARTTPSYRREPPPPPVPDERLPAPDLEREARTVPGRPPHATRKDPRPPGAAHRKRARAASQEMRTAPGLPSPHPNAGDDGESTVYGGLIDATTPGPPPVVARRGWLRVAVVVGLVASGGGLMFGLGGFDREDPVYESVIVAEAQPVPVPRTETPPKEPPAPPEPRAAAAPESPPPSPEAVPALHPAPARQVAEAPKPKRPRRVTPKASASAPENTETPPRPPATVNGTLTLVTEPWSTVYVSGRELGITPLVNVELPAGRHALRLVGPDQKAVSLSVRIEGGKETKVRVPLSALQTME